MMSEKRRKKSEIVFAREIMTYVEKNGGVTAKYLGHIYQTGFAVGFLGKSDAMIVPEKEWSINLILRFLNEFNFADKHPKSGALVGIWKNDGNIILVPMWLYKSKKVAMRAGDSQKYIYDIKNGKAIEVKRQSRVNDPIKQESRKTAIKTLWQKYCSFINADYRHMVWAKYNTEEIKLYDKSGVLEYEGCGTLDSKLPGSGIGGKDSFVRCGEGKEFYENGTLRSEGFYQRAGLLFGRYYYKSGKLKFEGQYNDKTHGHGGYYGPSFPVYGRYYSADGKLLYEGKFDYTSSGVGYRTITKPEGFGRYS